MRPDAWLPKIDPRHTTASATAHPVFMASVMALWDRGLDTRAIAAALFEREQVVAFCVALGREQRRPA